MTEYHPFKEFVPNGATMLILGSFPGKESTQEKRVDDWYYGASRNQFWKILELVYGCELKSLSEKQALFSQYGIAITDIIKSCKRSDNSASDKNLIDKVYNTHVIKKILENGNIRRVLFTSKGVEEEFSRHIEPMLKGSEYKKVILVTPSPVYRRENIHRKAQKYKKELPTVKAIEDRLQGRFGGADGITIMKD